MADLKGKLEKENQIIKETALQREREIRAAQDLMTNEKQREKLCIEKREDLLRRIEQMNIKSQALELQQSQVYSILFNLIDGEADGRVHRGERTYQQGTV